MSKRARDITIACVALGAAAASLYFAFGRRSENVDLGPYEVLGMVTAEETAKLVGNKGQVLVMAPDFGASKNPSVEAETKAFQQALQKQKSMSLATERIQASPMMMMATGGGVPVDQFFKAIEKHAGAAAVVLFFGFPQMADAELEMLKKTGVKTVVVSFFHPGYKRLMERQAIHLAIVPRVEPAPPEASAPRTVRERFDREFAVVTPADAARLP